MIRQPNFIKGISIEEAQQEIECLYEWQYRFGGLDRNRLNDLKFTIKLITDKERLK